MKKILLVFLIMLVFLSGCNATEKQDQNEAQAVSNEVDQVEVIENEENKVEVEVVEENNSESLPGALAVSIDNHRRAYPQSGLDKADIVYEMLAEGGITRYLAIFNSQKAEVIGPVRSARFYFVELVKGYDIPFAHAGGSKEALYMIPTLKLKDMDEIYNAGAYFWRDKSLKMPHNLYTSTELLLKGAAAKKYQLKNIETLQLGELTSDKEVKTITVTYTKDYKVSYEWNGEFYKRLINESPHLTPTGEEIITDNIVILEAQTRQYSNPDKIEIDIVGQGKALYFSDGKLWEGSWQKKSPEKDIEFLYMDEYMKFSGTRAWINVVPNLSSISTN